MKNIKTFAIVMLIFLASSCLKVDVADNLIETTLDYSTFETYGDALADQITAGDGAGIDGTFRNSGVVIDESDNTYFAVNGVHPVNNGDYTSYYPKSIVKASLTDDEIVRAYSFSSVNGRDIDMEALCYGSESGYLYIGDEYNYIYKLNLSTGQVEEEWNLSSIGISTNKDKGVEGMTYSSATGNFYVGVQGTTYVYEVSLGDNGSVTKVNTFAVGDSPSGMFAHADGTLYVLTFDAILRFTTGGTQTCKVSIPNGLGMTRPDGIYIDDSNQYIYLTDSQGPINNGYSMYKIAWTNPCN